MKTRHSRYPRRQFVAGIWRLGALATLAPWARLPSAAESAQIYSGKGQLIVAHLDSAPFPHPDRAQGRTYQGQIYPAEKHYNDNTVALFVPAAFRPTDRIDFVVHFHGWRNNVMRVLERYQLLEQFEQSGRNAVLVVPQGPRDAPDSFGGKLEDRDGFRRFMDDVLVTLRTRGVVTEANSAVGRIILSGHSGGYQVIASILDCGGLSDRVDEVWLFDALYARADSFLAWLQQAHGRLLVIYTEHGGTKQETERFLASLDRLGLKYIRGLESEVTPAQLGQRLPILLYSDLEHDAVIQGNRSFFRFLLSRILGKI